MKDHLLVAFLVISILGTCGCASHYKAKVTDPSQGAILTGSTVNDGSLSFEFCRPESIDGQLVETSLHWQESSLAKDESLVDPGEHLVEIVVTVKDGVLSPIRDASAVVKTTLLTGHRYTTVGAAGEFPTMRRIWVQDVATGQPASTEGAAMLKDRAVSPMWVAPDFQPVRK